MKHVWAVGNLHKFHTQPSNHVTGENLRPFVTHKQRPLSRPAMPEDDFWQVRANKHWYSLLLSRTQQLGDLVFLTSRSQNLTGSQREKASTRIARAVNMFPTQINHIYLSVSSPFCWIINLSVASPPTGARSFPVVKNSSCFRSSVFMALTWKIHDENVSSNFIEKCTVVHNSLTSELHEEMRKMEVQGYTCFCIHQAWGKELGDHEYQGVVAYQLPKPTNNLAVLCKPILIRCHPLQCLHNIQRSMRKKLQILVLNRCWNGCLIFQYQETTTKLTCSNRDDTRPCSKLWNIGCNWQTFEGKDYIKF